MMVIYIYIYIYYSHRCSFSNKKIRNNFSKCDLSRPAVGNRTNSENDYTKAVK